MTPADLTELIGQYRAGLEAEVVVLRRLHLAAARQREATAGQDFGMLTQAADDRDRLMAGLVAIEGELHRVREALSGSRMQARNLPGYDEAVELHRTALALVSSILQTDAESLQALAAAELARRDTARAMEQGETTLAAYRRVMTTLPGATLVDRLG